MKNILIFLIALLTINANAQQKQEHRKRVQNDFTPEQIATLKTKKMALHLNLSEAQHNKIYKLNLEQAQKRKSKIEARKPTNGSSERPNLSQEEKYELANDRLDAQIQHKKNMRDILNEEQFTKWEKGNKMKQRIGLRKGMKENRKGNTKHKRGPKQS